MDDEKNEITDKVKNKDKNKSKLENKIKKNIKRTIFLIAKIFIPIFLFIFLIVGIWYVIESLISIEVSTGTAGELADSTSISEDGAITVEDTVYEDIRKLLKDKGIDPEVFWLGENNYVEGTDTTYLEKMVAAEIASSYPDTGVGDIRGIVKIQRNNENLTYKSQADFQSLLDGAQSNGNIDDVKKYFTLDEELNIKVATSSKTTTKDTDGTETTTYKASPASLNYKNLISQYTMPFEFLFALMQSTENPEYVAKVADLALEESEIILNIYDTETTIETTTETTWDNVLYSGETRNTTRYNYSVPLSFESRTARGPETSEETTVSNSVSLKVTSVKTWIYSKTATYTQNTVSDTSESEPTVEDTITGSVNTTTSKDGDDYVVNKSRTDIENRTTKTTTTATSTSWQETGESTEKIDVNKFLGLWKNETGEYVQGELYKADGQVVYYHVPRENVQRSPAKFITKYPELLFSFLSNSQDTQGIERIMRYILYVYTGKDYGVTDPEALLDIFAIKDFQSISSNGLLKEYIHYWENAGGPPTSEDGKNYIIEDDGAGHPTAGYGVDIENSGYKHLFEEAGYPTHIGGEVPVEFVDSIENMIINEKRQEIEAIVSGLELKGYQMNALISRAYNCGSNGAVAALRGTPSMNFKDSYNEYWNAETDDLFEKQVKIGDFSHKLYKQYMSKPVTSNGQYMAGLENRRKSEWTLFQTGYYDLLNKWHVEGGTIIECAKAIHEYMEANRYTYCVYYCNNAEECGTFGKSCGLNRTFEESKTGFHNTCCATYVSWVLQEAGYINESEHTNGASNIRDILVGKGWQQVSYSELQPGDVLYYSQGHVEIYAGDNTVYNAGSGNAIRGASPHSKNVSSMSTAFRAPN